MLASSLSSTLSSRLASLSRLFRRFVSLFGQHPALAHNPEVEAYELLARLRHERSVRGGASAVLPIPACVDDAQVNLRISM